MTTSLKEYGISRIIAIDDIFDNLIQENWKYEDLEVHKELLDKLQELDDFQALIDFLKGSDNNINAYIKKNPSFNFDALKNEQLGSDYEPYKILKEVSQVDDYHELGLDEEKIKSCLSQSPNTGKKTLVVLDKDLEASPTTSKLKSILNIISGKLSEQNLLLVMYSNSPEVLNSYDEVIKYLEGRIGLEVDICKSLALHFNFIDKADDNILNRFIENLIKSQKASYISAYESIFTSAYDKLKQKIWELNKNQSLFYYDYLTEGQHVDDIIFSTFIDKIEQMHMKKFDDDESYLKFINPIRKSTQKYLKVSSKTIKQYRFIKELTYNFNQDKIKCIPYRSSDITFGDIICVEKDHDEKQFYMVVSQDCDITVRNNERRKSQFFQLIPVEQKNIKLTEKYIYKKLCDMKFKGNDLENVDIKTVFDNFNIGEDVINNLVTAFKENKDEENNDLDGERMINELSFNNYIGKKKEGIYSLSCIWLDCLTLRKQNGMHVLSDGAIETSYEIRESLKKCIKTEFQDLLAKFEGPKTPEEINKFLKYSELHSLFGIEAESKLESEKLSIILKNISRVERLPFLEAKKIYHDILENQTRIPTSLSNLI